MNPVFSEKVEDGVLRVKDVEFDERGRVARLDTGLPVAVLVNEEVGLRVRTPGVFAAVGDLLVPSWVEVEFQGDAATPTQLIRVEVRDGVPRVVDVELHAKPWEGEIRQSHIREMNAAGVANLFAVFALRAVNVDRAAKTIDIRLADLGDDFAERLRTIRGARANRKVTPAFLREVADVYKANLRAGPTRAVKERFFVSERTASGYVQQARKAGFLPPTTPGKRKA